MTTCVYSDEGFFSILDPERERFRLIGVARLLPFSRLAGDFEGLRAGGVGVGCSPAANTARAFSFPCATPSEASACWVAGAAV